MKRILLTIESKGPGGAETVVLHLARALKSRQFPTRVVYFRAGWLRDRLEEAGIEHVHVPSERGWDIGLVKKLAHQVREFNADLVHAHLPGTNLYSSVAGKLTGRPVVTTWHGEMVMPGSTVRFAGVKNAMIRRWASWFVMVADYIGRDFLDVAGFPKERTSTIYNGIPLPKEMTADELKVKRASIGVADGEPVAGIVANLRTPKGYEYLIEAARIVCEEIPNARFVSVGQGRSDIESKIRSLIAEYKLEKNVRLLGFRSDVSELLQLFDVFTLSSISEGLPLSVVEAMAARKPVVVTDVGGLAELVDNGASGYLVPPRAPEALAAKLLAVLKDRGHASQLGERGREIVEQRFTIEKMVDDYLALYDRLLTT